MAEKISVTSIMHVPITVGWTCSSCGTKNAVETNLKISNTTTKEGYYSKEMRDANKAGLEEKWACDAAFFIMGPGVATKTNTFQDRVNISNCKCSNCKKREKWALPELPILLTIPAWACFIVLLFSGCSMFDANNDMSNTITFWISLVCFVILAIIVSKIEKDRRNFADVPSESMPTLITFNDEVVNFAKNLGTDLLSEERLNATGYKIVYDDDDDENTNISKNPKVEPKPAPIVSIDFVDKKLSPKLRRAFILIEDEEWEKADSCLESFLETEPENAYAYLGKMMVALKINDINNIPNNLDKLKTLKEYKHALKYGDEDLLKLLKN